MGSSFAIWAAWILSNTLLMVVVGAMLLRGTRRTFPWFFASMAFALLNGTFGMLVYRLFPGNYAYYYWAMDTVDSVLSFVALQEAYEHMFRPCDTGQSTGRWFFRWAVGVSVLLALATAVLTGTQVEGNVRPWVPLLILLQRTVAITMMLSVVVLLIAMKVAGIRPRHYAFGIVLGLGFIGTIISAVEFLRNIFKASFDFYSNLHQISYLITLCVWIYYFAGSHREVTKYISKLPDMRDWYQTIVPPEQV